MLRLLRWTMVPLLASVFPACATMNVSSHAEPGLDITRYRTWAWAAADSLPASDARLDNGFFRDHFEGAVEIQFAMRGLELVDRTGSPDLLVHYHAVVSPRLVGIDMSGRADAYYDEAVPVIENETATLVIDMVDSRTGRLVWRGWAQTDFDDLVQRADRFRSGINTAVRKMFARLPGSAA